eukprot:153628_1
MELQHEFRLLMQVNCISDQDLEKFGTDKHSLYWLAVGTLKYQYFAKRLNNHHDGAEHVINIVKDIANIIKCNLTKKVDYLLGKCYETYGKDYYDENNNGKFFAFVNDNGM